MQSEAGWWLVCSAFPRRTWRSPCYRETRDPAPLGGVASGASPPVAGFGSRVFGRVTSVGNGTFTVAGRTGASVTVDEQSSTTYYNGGTSATVGTVTTGERVAVQGTRSGTTVTAERVTVLPAGGFGPPVAG